MMTLIVLEDGIEDMSKLIEFKTFFKRFIMEYVLGEFLRIFGI